MRENEAEDQILIEYLQKARSLLESRAFQEAKEFYEKVVERCDELTGLNPKNAYPHYMKACALYELKFFEESDSVYARKVKDALAEIDIAIELNPEIHYYHYLRNEILGELTYHPDWSLKWGWYGELEIDASLMFLGPSLNYVRGFTVDADGAPIEIYSENELDEIEYVYEQYLKRYPKDPDCHNNLGAIYYEIGIWHVNVYQVKEAVEKLNEAIALNPNNPAYYNNRALALYSLIKFKEETRKLKNEQIDSKRLLKEVFNDLEKSVKLDPGNPYYHYNLGLILYDAERYEEAIRELDEAIALDSSNPYYYYKKGITLYRLEKYDESLEQFREALKLSKDSRIINYMIDLIETVKDREKGIGPFPKISSEAITMKKKEDEIFLRSSDLQPDEALSKVKEIISIAQRFGLINPETSREKLKNMEKLLWEKLSEKKLSLNSLMLTLCFYCPAYWFDTRMIHGAEDYVKLASNLSGITRGLLPLSEIECQEVRSPSKQRPEKYVLSFVAWEEKYMVELPFLGSWAQCHPIVKLLNTIIEKRGRSERYVWLDTRDQTAYLIFCIPENYWACRKTIVELLYRWSTSRSVKDD